VGIVLTNFLWDGIKSHPTQEVVMAKKLTDKEKIDLLIDILEEHLVRPDVDRGWIMNTLQKVNGKNYWEMPVDHAGDTIMPWRKS
jgi:hypothetical protein